MYPSPRDHGREDCLGGGLERIAVERDVVGVEARAIRPRRSPSKLSHAGATAGSAAMPRSAVCPRFDFDAPAVWFGYEHVTPAILQRGEYGARVCVPCRPERLCALWSWRVAAGAHWPIGWLPRVARLD